MPFVKNQGVSQHQKTPETLQGDHEPSFGDQVHCHQLQKTRRSYTHDPYKQSLDLNRQQHGNNGSNTHQQGHNGYLDQHGNNTHQQGNIYYWEYVRQEGNTYYWNYVDQQGNIYGYCFHVRQQGNYTYYYNYVDQQGNYTCYCSYRDERGDMKSYCVPQHLIPRHHHRPRSYRELLDIYVSKDMRQIPHGPVPALDAATTSCFQAVDTTPSDKSVTLYWGGLDGSKGEAGMLYDLDSLIRIAVPQDVQPAIKFHYVHCNPEKNMVFVGVADARVARLLCHYIHHRFFFDTAKQILFHGTTETCGEEMYQALQINNARGNKYLAVLVEKKTLRNIVTCEIEDPNYKNRNR